ncbi:uncharacterized protein LOC117065853 [Trachypithecus francoisi]|uniref:uncharacterized protein LOC117065853 n=1 Tax=Trachypithecus francoisi TaxID=54180 RepID=UPI00141B6669|nr:uncharacterized protein LOC117065853 [Trachypithecus francoisi]
MTRSLDARRVSPSHYSPSPERGAGACELSTQARLHATKHQALAAILSEGSAGRPDSSPTCLALTQQTPLLFTQRNKTVKITNCKKEDKSCLQHFREARFNTAH